MRFFLHLRQNLGQVSAVGEHLLVGEFRFGEQNGPLLVQPNQDGPQKVCSEAADGVQRCRTPEYDVAKAARSLARNRIATVARSPSRLKFGS